MLCSICEAKGSGSPWSGSIHCDKKCRIDHAIVIGNQCHGYCPAILTVGGKQLNLDAIEGKFMGMVCAPGKDTCFFVGNQAKHRNTFSVIGMWYPPAATPVRSASAPREARG